MTSGLFCMESPAGQPPRAPTLPLLMTCMFTRDSEVFSRPVPVLRNGGEGNGAIAQLWQGSVFLYENRERYRSSLCCRVGCGLSRHTGSECVAMGYGDCRCTWRDPVGQACVCQEHPSYSKKQADLSCP